ncbi:MAG TPA: type VI secretion system ATPase TssH [Stellaceae bacterium]|nr:type VI secretion system ATPase TssH [Stellaceae bacterium]
MSDVKALISKLNPACKRALETAAELCLAQTHFSVEVEHLLLKLAEKPDGDVQRVLRYYEIDAGAVAKQLGAAIEKLKRGNSRTPSLSPHLLTLFEGAWVISSLRLAQPAIRSGAVLLALLDDDALRALLLEAVPVLATLPRGRLAEDLPELLHGTAEDPAPQPAATSSAPARAGAPSRSPALDAYTIDLTAEAEAGRIDPIIGRDAEIRQIVDVLMRRRQNNPILTGEAGVGKTAIVEGFAQRIVSGDVPPPLRPVQVRILDLGLLQAGAGIKGEFENRLKQVIEEVRGSPRPVVLFIDEAHTLIGAGGAAGQGDAANLLKPALARGELRTIAATTWAEYKKYFEKDPALARRFQVIKVEEPDEAAAIAMLRGLVPKLERHHGVRILEEAVGEAVRLSHRYIAGRQLPDKAVSLLDTAAARVAIAQASQPPALQDAIRRCEALKAEIELLSREKIAGRDHAERIERLLEEQAQSEETRHRLAARWEQERATVRRLGELERDVESAAPGKDIAGLLAMLGGVRLELEAIQEGEAMVPAHVDTRTIAEVVSGWTGIPVGKMLSDRIATVRGLKQRMTERVVGQEAALEVICRRMQTYHADLSEPGKPTGVFLLVGPSGVGKTETAITLADLLYGGERTMITVNMSEYQEAHSVSGLKGAPPGYVGYGKGGVLTEAVRRNPYTVVLLDEVEKAHPDVLELFYQVFDKGVLEDSEGQVVNFKNATILLTCNIGAETIIDLVRASRGQIDAGDIVEAIRPELVRHFKPAFLGRLVVVPYLPLGDAEVENIVRLKLRRVQERFWDTYRAELTCADAVVSAIAARCTEIDTGARAIDNLLTNTLLPELSGEILARVTEGAGFELVHIELDGKGGLRFVFDDGTLTARER